MKFIYLNSLLGNGLFFLKGEGVEGSREDKKKEGRKG